MAHVLAVGALNRKLSTFGGQKVYAFEGSAAPQEAVSESDAAQPPRRQLRVLFAEDENATVVVSAIHLHSK